MESEMRRLLAYVIVAVFVPGGIPLVILHMVHVRRMKTIKRQWLAGEWHLGRKGGEDARR